MANVYIRKKPGGGQFAKWYFSYTDSAGKRKVKAGFPRDIDIDGKDTQRIAYKLELEALEIRKGDRKPPTIVEINSSKSVIDIIAEYRNWGNTQGGRDGRAWSYHHSTNVKRCLNFWVVELGLSVMTDLSNIISRVEQAMQTLLSNGLAGKTVNGYAAALKGFISWSIKREYLEKNPLVVLTKVNEKPSYVRRAMTLEEIHKLLRAAPKHRALLYEVAFCTGLRKNELRNLTPHHLDMINMGIVLKEEWTKNRKCGFCPLPDLLLSRLSTYGSSGEALSLYHKYCQRRNCTRKIPENPLLFVPAHIDEITIEDLEKPELKDITIMVKLIFMLAGQPT